jgi:hypothetical protein
MYTMPVIKNFLVTNIFLDARWPLNLYPQEGLRIIDIGHY